MKKILGILTLFIVVCCVTTVVNPQFVTPFNLENLIRWTALFGIISIGVSFVIITGGIDLSIGSVIGLTGCLLPMFLTVNYAPTGGVYTVDTVDVAQKAISLRGEAIFLRKGDRLDYKTLRGSDRQLTIESASEQSGGVVIQVRESPARLQEGASVSLSHMRHVNVPLAVGLVLLISAAIGLTHGLLITKLRLQPFVVTLCGLLFYRGYARYLAGDEVQGFGTGFDGLKYLASGKPFSIPVPFLQWIHEGNWGRVKWDYQAGAPAADDAGYTIPLDVWEWIAVPMPVAILLAIAALGIVFLNFSVWGRYLLALGRNEQAARYSGVNTDRMIIVAYVICSTLAGLAGILFALDLNSVQPSGHGSFYELYAIAAAVLGGCSLRGGEGSIVGVIIGAAVMRVLYNSINLMGIPTQLEFAIIGLVILAGVIADELVKRYAARRRARSEAVQADRAPASPSR